MRGESFSNAKKAWGKHWSGGLDGAAGLDLFSPLDFYPGMTHELILDPNYVMCPYKNGV